MTIVSKTATAAIELAALGWPVVPLHGVKDGVCSCPKGKNCASPGKHPRLRDWPTQATNNVDKVRKWFEKWPDANVGVRLGTIVDVEHDTAEGAATAAELLSDVETASYRSDRSVHWLFLRPQFTPSKAVVHKRGLECRFGTESKGAQSVVPPSVHASGKEYRWLDGRSPWQIEIAPFPESLAALLCSDSVANSGEFTMSDAMPFAEHPGASEGNRHKALCSLVGTRLSTHGADPALVPEALAWAERCKPPLPQDEALKVVGDLVTRHQGQATPMSTPAKKLVSTPYAAIASQSVSWLWEQRIPLGKLTLLVGDPGLGKTFLACDLAARVSRGATLPDGATALAGEVAILTAEDGAGDTLRPRLDAHEADVSKVHHIEGVRSGDEDEFVSLQEHLALVGQWLVEHPECRLFVIDPISAFLGKCDSHNNADVRSVLSPVAKLAEQYNVAVLGITHLSKAQGSSLARITGSIAFVAAARAAWRVGADPDDPQRRLFLPVKNNLGTANGLAFRIIEGRVEWEPGEVLVSADELDDSEHQTPREEAERWLRAELAAGAVASAQVLKHARADGISERTLYRAKKDLGVTSDKIGNAWHWCLPEEPIQPCDSQDVYVVD